MYLCDTDIRNAVNNWKITISDFEEERLNPASYDILLWNNFILTDSHSTWCIDPVKKILPKTHEVCVETWWEFILHPWVSILWTSLDYFWSSDYLIHLGWKSSLARIWLLVHNTAWIVNPWHYLNITLELCNLNSVPIILRPWMRIAQITFSPLSGVPEKLYDKTWRYVDKNWAGYVPEKC